MNTVIGQELNRIPPLGAAMPRLEDYEEYHKLGYWYCESCRSWKRVKEWPHRHNSPVSKPKAPDWAKVYAEMDRK